MAKSGLLLTTDLFFASKVTGTAGALGLAVQSVGSLASLRDACSKSELGLVILDLDCRGVSPAEVIAEIPTDQNIVTMAFGPHVHTDKLAAARQAGFQQVMPRSKFSSELADLLRNSLADV